MYFFSFLTFNLLPPGLVITTLRISDGPVSITHEFWKEGGQFIKLRSIKEGLSGFM